MTYVKAIRSESARILMKDKNAYMLLTQIAHRAKRSDNIQNNLNIGDALIGDYRSIGLTEMEYRGAKTRLKNIGQITTRPTNKGTIATIIKTDIYDINIDSNNGLEIKKQQTDNEPITTNKKLRSKEEKDLLVIELQSRFFKLLQRYPNHKLIQDAFDGISITRKNGKVADSIFVAELEFWKNFPVPVVEKAIRTYLHGKHHLNGKKENYLRGIIRNDNEPLPKTQKGKYSNAVC